MFCNFLCINSFPLKFQISQYSYQLINHLSQAPNLRHELVIEVFFKTTKSLLNPQKGFQNRSYDALNSHTTSVFTRYIILSWQNIGGTDNQTLVGMFYELCDEVNDLNWTVALQQLIDLLEVL